MSLLKSDIKTIFGQCRQHQPYEMRFCQEKALGVRQEKVHSHYHLPFLDFFLTPPFVRVTNYFLLLNKSEIITIILYSILLILLIELKHSRSLFKILLNAVY